MLNRLVCCHRPFILPRTGHLLSDLRNQDDTSLCHHKNKRPLSSEIAERPKDDRYVVDPNQKPKTNVPFIKNLFSGKFDKWIFVYPELKTTEEVNQLENFVQPIEEYILQSDSKAIDSSRQIPNDIIDELKSYCLFGQQIPKEYGGLEFSATQLARVSEVTALDGSIYATLQAHQSLATKAILLAGTGEQKERYLPKLASADKMAAFCLTEVSGGSDLASIESRATLSGDRQTYHLTGEKTWVINGGQADIFVVFAKVKVPYGDEEDESKVTAFIVQRGFGGVTNSPSHDTLGIRGAEVCTVKFDNTPIPVDHVLGGEPGNGFQIAMDVLEADRHLMGSSCAGILKTLLSEAVDHVISRSQFKQKLHEFGLIQEKLTRIAATTYAIESMAYLTAGTIDHFQEPDCALESAAVKIFSSEGFWTCINDIMQIFGGQSFMKDQKYERFLRDGYYNFLNQGTNEILRLYIALMGLQHAAKDMKDTLRQLKDPFNNFKFYWETTKNRVLDRKSKKPKLKMLLADDVHPTLSFIASDLERAVIKLEWVVQDTLSIHQNDIVKEQLVLKRLSDVVMDMYAISACLSRTTRSLSIGLRNADHEKALTSYFAGHALSRIDLNLNLLAAGRFEAGDEICKTITDNLCKHHGWASEHPLARNW